MVTRPVRARITDFFNYGEGVSPQASRRDVRILLPMKFHIYLYEHQRPGLQRSTSAAPGAFRASTKSPLIDGASQQTHARYRQRGKFDVALANLRAMADEKACRAGRDVPQLNWRYILPTWNDNDEEVDPGAQACGGGRRGRSVLGDYGSFRRLFAAVRGRVAGAGYRSGPRDLG